MTGPVTCPYHHCNGRLHGAKLEGCSRPGECRWRQDIQRERDERQAKADAAAREGDGAMTKATAVWGQR